MSRPRLNLYLDIAAFLSLTGVVATGLVLRLELPAGSGRLLVGPGGGTVLTLWGLTRHEWGTLHYGASLLLLSILGLHVWLHRDWLTSVARREKSRPSSGLLGLGLAAGVALLAAAVAPFLGSPRSQTRNEVLAERGSPQTRGPLCVTEGVSLDALQLADITGVPAEKFQGVAKDGAIDVAQARAAIQSYYSDRKVAAEPSGQRLFEQHCARCHDAAALGQVLRAEGGIQQLREARPAEPHRVMSDLSESDLSELLSYLQARRGSP